MWAEGVFDWKEGHLWETLTIKSSMSRHGSRLFLFALTHVPTKRHRETLAPFIRYENSALWIKHWTNIKSPRLLGAFIITMSWNPRLLPLMVWRGPSNPRRRGCLDCVGDYEEFWVNIWNSFHTETSIAGLVQTGTLCERDVHYPQFQTKSLYIRYWCQNTTYTKALCSETAPVIRVRDVFRQPHLHSIDLRCKWRKLRWNISVTRVQYGTALQVVIVNWVR